MRLVLFVVLGKILFAAKLAFVCLYGRLFVLLHSLYQVQICHVCPFHADNALTTLTHIQAQTRSHFRICTFLHLISHFDIRTYPDMRTFASAHLSLLSFSFRSFFLFLSFLFFSFLFVFLFVAVLFFLFRFFSFPSVSFLAFLFHFFSICILSILSLYLFCSPNSVGTLRGSYASGKAADA